MVLSRFCPQQSYDGEDASDSSFSDSEEPLKSVDEPEHYDADSALFRLIDNSPRVSVMEDAASYARMGVRSADTALKNLKALPCTSLGSAEICDLYYQFVPGFWHIRLEHLLEASEKIDSPEKESRDFLSLFYEANTFSPAERQDLVYAYARRFPSAFKKLLQLRSVQVF